MNCVEANIDITILEGGTFDKTWQWVIGGAGSPVDLTGYTGIMQIRTSLKNDTILLNVPAATVPWTPDGVTGIYITPADGKYRVYLNGSNTLGMCAEHKDLECVYDLFLRNADGEEVLKQYGNGFIKAAVTRT